MVTYSSSNRADKDLRTLLNIMCRSFLSPYFDEDGNFVNVGRGNIGVVSLNLPMIWKKSDGKTFYEDLENYLLMIRKFFKKRMELMADMPASINPVMWLHGGFKSDLKYPDEKIGYRNLKSFTASFGVTALNELNMLMEGKFLHQSDRKLVNGVVDFINEKIEEYKEEDGILYSIYGTPKLLGLWVVTLIE